MLKYKWGEIDKQSDWATYKNDVSAFLSDWDCSSFITVSEVWSSLSIMVLIVNCVGSDVIGCKSIKGNSRKLWDSEIGKLLKCRKTANQLWSQSGGTAPTLVQGLWEKYLERTHIIQTKLKQECIAKLKLLH